MPVKEVKKQEHVIRRILIKRGKGLLSAPFKPIRFTGHVKADNLLNDLDRYPHAFVLACIMDRQVKAEKAWLIPFEFGSRLGSFNFSALRKLSLQKIQLLMTKPKPLHRFPEQMGRFFYAAIRRINSRYSGNAANIWAGNPSSAAIVRQFLEFEGIGPKIATMAANILVRDFKVPVSDKYSIDVSPDVHVRRVFSRLGLISREASKEVLIYRARELNPEYPGIFDLPAWEIGRNWCKPKDPLCTECYMQNHCPTAELLWVDKQ